MPPSPISSSPADVIPEARSAKRDHTAKPGGPGRSDRVLTAFEPLVGERTLDLFDRAKDPGDPIELRDLYLGRVECECVTGDANDPRAILWRESKKRRSLRIEDVLSSRATVRFVKEMFNAFFRDDLYGRFRTDDTIILSSGSVCEECFGLPGALKSALTFAIDRDWYGYSDSLGRAPAREAVARYENARIRDAHYSEANIAITMGATAAINALADFFLSGRSATDAPALCAIPNYPPLVEAIARRHGVQQVPLAANDGKVDIDSLIDALRPDTPLVLLQTVANPTGAVVDEASLSRFIDAASPSTMILLDECHECIPELAPRSAARAASNVVRITSMSKTWSVPGMKIGWMIADPAVIADYYEFASTSYGGPPSFFFTLVEFTARMERWFLEGLDSPGQAQVAEFDPGYGFNRDSLQVAFRSYRADRAEREKLLIRGRTEFADALRGCGLDVLNPAHSINAIVSEGHWNDSYVAFRDMLARFNVSFYPSLLNFGYDSPAVRVTTSRSASDLRSAIERFAARA